jgi:peroxiredoxin
MQSTRLLLFVLGAAFPALQLNADHPADSDSSTIPGHSMHSEAFNEGPRQAAYLMNGMGNVHWPISTKNPMAQRFFDQGIVQLHGFWYFEAERSFRQAAAFDPSCAMLYWGMARANIENINRSRGFIAQAVQRRDSASEKEKRLIDAWSARVKESEAEAKRKDAENRAKDGKSADSKKTAAQAKKKNDEARRKEQKDRLKEYVAELEKIACDYPDDIELKAMLVLQYWQNGEIQSPFAINGLLSDIFHSNPKHPAHHFRIHLWDYKKDQLALDAAAKCGPSAPGIAHMWHMPGHTYSRLHRYADAAWQQEASARVDHAHMQRDQILPDQIHNYAHNNEWLIRDLQLIGRVREAIDLAKNMIELPRHPKFNKISGRGSASLGRERLLGTLTIYQRWADIVELCPSNYLDPGDDELKQDELAAWQAIAFCNLGREEDYQKHRTSLHTTSEKLKSDLDRLREELKPLEMKEAKKSDGKLIRPPKLLAPTDGAVDLFGDENDPLLPKLPAKEIADDETWEWSEERKEVAKKLRTVEYRLAKLRQFQLAIDAYAAAKAGRFRDALLISHECRALINANIRMEWLADAGLVDQAMDRIEKRIKDGSNELLPLATGVWIASKSDLSQDKHASRCKGWIEALSPIAATADAPLGELDRLLPTVEKMGWKEEWKVPAKPPTDLGDRPPLESLGPFRWSPPKAPMWSATGADGEIHSNKTYGSKPLVLILYLGFGCVHCAEQLKTFSPQVEEFRKNGIEVAAISTETLSKLQTGLRNYEESMRVPLIANPELDIFREFRCFDDFEGVPLHGTFLIDSDGRIRWQDIGHEPFMDVKFLMEESKRLLKF